MDETRHGESPTDYSRQIIRKTTQQAKEQVIRYLRRSPAWGNENICGRATRGQSYFVKEIHKVNGKKMVRTVGDVYLSGESEHVQFEQV